ncbi:MAG: hypothetical protein GY953_11150 [bacterium]|nr:hypothetical protein [bacterium]
MDEVDQACAGQALEHAPDNETVRWENPTRDARYEVTPSRSYNNGDGRYCREYQTTGEVGGQKQRAYGRACRQPDGSWEIIS